MPVPFDSGCSNPKVSIGRCRLLWSIRSSAQFWALCSILRPILGVRPRRYAHFWAEADFTNYDERERPKRDQPTAL